MEHQGEIFVSIAKNSGADHKWSVSFGSKNFPLVNSMIKPKPLLCSSTCLSESEMVSSCFSSKWDANALPGLQRYRWCAHSCELLSHCNRGSLPEPWQAFLLNEIANRGENPLFVLLIFFLL